MGRARTLALLGSMLVAWAGPALATAGFSCSIADKAVKFSAEGVLSRGAGEGVMNFGGKIEVLGKGAPDDLRTVDLEREHLTQSWLHGKDIKLRMYREREGNGSNSHSASPLGSNRVELHLLSNASSPPGKRASPRWQPGGAGRHQLSDFAGFQVDHMQLTPTGPV